MRNVFKTENHISYTKKFRFSNTSRDWFAEASYTRETDSLVQKKALFILEQHSKKIRKVQNNIECKPQIMIMLYK